MLGRYRSPKYSSTQGNNEQEPAETTDNRHRPTTSDNRMIDTDYKTIMLTLFNEIKDKLENMCRK